PGNQNRDNNEAIFCISVFSHGELVRTPSAGLETSRGQNFNHLGGTAGSSESASRISKTTARTQGQLEKFKWIMEVYRCRQIRFRKANILGRGYIGTLAIESGLSGVGKEVGKDKALWYNRTISIPKALRKGRTLLHFGAVDWQCDVYVNGQHIGQHEGGFDPFSFDITAALKKGTEQDVVVRVWDPTSEGPQP